MNRNLISVPLNLSNAAAATNAAQILGLLCEPATA